MWVTREVPSHPELFLLLLTIGAPVVRQLISLHYRSAGRRQGACAVFWGKVFTICRPRIIKLLFFKFQAQSPLLLEYEMIIQKKNGNKWVDYMRIQI